MQNLKGYDETVDITDPEDIATPRPPSQNNLTFKDSSHFDRNNSKSTMSEDESFGAEKMSPQPQLGPKEGKRLAEIHDLAPKGLTDTEESSDEDDEDEDDVPQVVAGAYNPAEFENIAVAAEIKELFQYIQRYTPQTIELETKLKPFIPDYIPAVGDIDAFIKVPRPDLKPDNLGLRVLDEPCALQSDPTVLDLQLRALSKQTSAKQAVVRSITDAEKQPKKIESWITSITDLHRAKPPPSVHYNKNMPDVESLMQVWPPEVEQLLKTSSLPTGDLDTSLVTFIDLICGILDIPIYNNRIQSLHLLFTVYNEFKNSQHFQSDKIMG